MYTAIVATLLITVLIPVSGMQTTSTNNITKNSTAEHSKKKFYFDLARENENLKNRTIHPFMLYGTLHPAILENVRCYFCKSERGHAYIEKK